MKIKNKNYYYGKYDKSWKITYNSNQAEGWSIQAP